MAEGCFQRWTINFYHSKMHGRTKWLATVCWLLESWLRFEVVGRCINKFSGSLLGVKLDIAATSAGPSWLIFEIAQIQQLGEPSPCMILICNYRFCESMAVFHLCLHVLA